MWSLGETQGHVADIFGMVDTLEGKVTGLDVKVTALDDKVTALADQMKVVLEKLEAAEKERKAKEKKEKDEKENDEKKQKLLGAELIKIPLQFQKSAEKLEASSKDMMVATLQAQLAIIGYFGLEGVPRDAA